MGPYYSNYPSTFSWNTSSPPVGPSLYESNPSSFSTSSNLTFSVAQQPVNPNALGNQNLNRIPMTSVYESDPSSFSTNSSLSYPFAQPPVNPNILGNQNLYRIPKTSGVMDLDYAKDSSTCSWNTYSPPVGFSVYNSHQSSFRPSSDLSYPVAQALVNPNILGNQNLYRIPSNSGIQCLWETGGQICNHWYQNPEELGAHISSIHMPKGSVVCHWKVCDRQGKTFPARNRLLNHVRSHTGETPFECDLCGKRFVTAESRKIHRRIHTGEKPFLCPVDGCSERFTTPTQLMIHKKCHLDPKPYHCKECDHKYTSLSSLRKHTKKHHEKKSAGKSGSGESSTGASSVSESPAPAYYNQANIPNHAQVEEHSGVYYNNYQVDPYNNYGYHPM